MSGNGFDAADGKRFHLYGHKDWVNKHPILAILNPKGLDMALIPSNIWDKKFYPVFAHFRTRD